jgi:hypothetical protein
MGVVIKLGARKAFLRQGQWRCADGAVEHLLNREMERWIQETGGPALESADPEAEAAHEMARRGGGVVHLHAPAKPRASRRLYFDRRQFRFDFGGDE